MCLCVYSWSVISFVVSQWALVSFFTFMFRDSMCICVYTLLCGSLVCVTCVYNGERVCVDL